VGNKGDRVIDSLLAIGLAHLLAAMACAPVTWGRWPALLVFAARRPSTLLYTGPLLALLASVALLALRGDRAREGSLLQRVDRRRPWTLVWTGLAAGALLAAIYGRHVSSLSLAFPLAAAFAFVAVARNLVLDTRAMRAVQEAQRLVEAAGRNETRAERTVRPRGDRARPVGEGARVTDVGVGAGGAEEVVSEGDPFRARGRVTRVVIGDPAAVADAVAASVLLDFSAVLVAGAAAAPLVLKALAG
jgi:hypothetical protein